MSKLILKLILVLFIMNWSFVYADGNTQLKDLSVHFQIASDHPDFAILGPYPKLERYNLHDDTAPQRIDVVLNIKGNMPVTVFLDIIPVVGQTGWAADEGITDFELVEASKMTFPSIQHFEQKLVLKGKAEVVFSDINLASLIDRFAKVDLWPRELIFKAGLVPHRRDKDISDNISSLSITLDPPD